MAVHCIILLLLSIILCLIPIHLSIRILRSNFISEHVEFSILLSSSVESYACCKYLDWNKNYSHLNYIFSITQFI